MLVTTGVVTVSHFCMDRLASVSFYGGSQKKCGKCGMEKSAHSCCNDEAAFSKISTGHFMATATAVKVMTASQQALLLTRFLLTPLQNGEQLLPTGNTDPPPLHQGTPVFLRNNVFRI
ncbi:hypothetical protein GCM10027051_18950 [Niabella terrae]